MMYSYTECLFMYEYAVTVWVIKWTSTLLKYIIKYNLLIHLTKGGDLPKDVYTIAQNGVFFPKHN